MLAARRVVFLLLCGLTVFACTRAEPPVWATPAPPNPPVQGFNTGDPRSRPVMGDLRISHFEVRNGWWVVPGNSHKISAEVQGADEVVFHGYFPETDTVNPKSNGIVEFAKPEVKDGRQRWVAESMAPGGRTEAIYAVARNKHGQTVSPVLFVAWDYKPRPANELKEP